MLNTVLSYSGVFIGGVLFGAFALRRNPIKGAKTLDDLERIYAEAKDKLSAKLRK